MPSPLLLHFDPPLATGTLVRRYKRFLADILLEDGSEVTAHCPDPGAMHCLAEPGRPVALSHSDNPRRRLPFTWEMVRMEQTWVGIHTNRSNRLVETALGAGAIDELAGLDDIQREVTVGDSRLDFRLRQTSRPGDCYLEVKTVTLRNGDTAQFPDSVTTRGQKHLRQLMQLRGTGHRAVALFLVNRSDCSQFAPAEDIDPVYAGLLREAQGRGVEILAYRTHWTPQQVTLDRSIDTVL